MLVRGRMHFGRRDANEILDFLSIQINMNVYLNDVLEIVDKESTYIGRVYDMSVSQPILESKTPAFVPAELNHSIFDANTLFVVEKQPLKLIKNGKTSIFPWLYSESDMERVKQSMRHIEPVAEYTSIYHANMPPLAIYQPSPDAFDTTLSYYFDKMKTGIFVRIVNNKLFNFIPFYNTSYTNDFHHLLDMKTVKALQLPASKVNPNTKQWHATNCLLRTEPDDGKPSDTYLSQFYDMLVETCSHKVVHDCMFVMTRKEFPHLRLDWKESFDALFGEAPLDKEYRDKPFLPVVAQCSTVDHADFTFPTGDDWDMMNPEKKFASYHTSIQWKNDASTFELPPWEQRKNAFIWRGQSSGCGNTSETNPRMHLHDMNLPHLDAKITRFTERIKGYHVDGTIQVDFHKPSKKTGPFLPMNKQVQYKFILNVEGNAAAFRYGGLFHLGFCILNVESKYKLWFENPAFGLHMGSVHNTADVAEWHGLAVKQDLSDLEETMAWCLAHDDECKRMAVNALAFHKQWLTKTSVYDYIADMCNTMSTMLTKQHETSPIVPKTKLTITDLPTTSTSFDKTCIIVPYRDNGDQHCSEQLATFLKHYSGRTILIVEQSNDGYKFNRGALFNIGVHYLRRTKNHIDTYILHDVDIIMPLETVEAYYGNATAEYGFVHLGNLVESPKYGKDFLGKIVKIHKDTYEAMNGFSNLFYGWGGEDALRHRIHKIARPKNGKLGKESDTINVSSDKDKSGQKMLKHELVVADTIQWKMEGFNSIQYAIVDDTSTKITVQLLPFVTTKSKQDEPTKRKQDEPTKSKQDEPTKSKQDESTKSIQDESTKSKQDESTKSKQDESTKSIQDESTKPDLEIEWISDNRDWLTIVVPARKINGTYVYFQSMTEEWIAAEKTQRLCPITFSKPVLEDCNITLLYRPDDNIEVHEDMYSKSMQCLDIESELNVWETAFRGVQTPTLSAKHMLAVAVQRYRELKSIRAEVFVNSNNLPVASAPLTATKLMFHHTSTSMNHGDAEHFLSEFTQPITTWDRLKYQMSLLTPSVLPHGKTQPFHSTVKIMVGSELVTFALLPHEEVALPVHLWVRMPWVDYNQACRPESTILEKLVGHRLAPHLYYIKPSPKELSDLLPLYSRCIKQLPPFYSIQDAFNHLSRHYMDGNSLHHDYMPTLQSAIAKHCSTYKSNLPSRIRSTINTTRTFSEVYVQDLIHERYHTTPTITHSPAQSIAKTFDRVSDVQLDNDGYKTQHKTPSVLPKPQFETMDKDTIKHYFMETNHLTSSEAASMTKLIQNHQAIPGDYARVVAGDAFEYYKWSGTSWEHEARQSPERTAPIQFSISIAKRWYTYVNMNAKHKISIAEPKPISDAMTTIQSILTRSGIQKYQQLRLFLQSIRATESNGWYVLQDEVLLPLVFKDLFSSPTFSIQACIESGTLVVDNGSIVTSVGGYSIQSVDFISSMEDNADDVTAPPTPQLVSIVQAVSDVMQCSLAKQVGILRYYSDQSNVNCIAAGVLLASALHPKKTLKLSQLCKKLAAFGIVETEGSIQKCIHYLEKNSTFSDILKILNTKTEQFTSHGFLSSFHALPYKHVSYTTHVPTRQPTSFALTIPAAYTPVQVEPPSLPHFMTKYKVSDCDIPLHGIPCDIVETTHAILSGYPSHVLITFIHSMYSKHTVSNIPPSMKHATPNPITHPIQLTTMMSIDKLYTMSASELVCYILVDLVPLVDDALEFHTFIQQDLYSITSSQLREANQMERQKEYQANKNKNKTSPMLYDIGFTEIQHDVNTLFNVADEVDMGDDGNSGE